MNRLLLISGIVVLAATFLITNTPNTTMAYSCSSSSGTQITSSQTGVSGSSGSCSSSSSASTSSGTGPHRSADATAATKGPNGQTDLNANLGGIPHRPPVTTATASSSVGGAQSSCTSTFSFGSDHRTSADSGSVSQPGQCSVAEKP
jgi:hypothetical protein